MLAYKGFNSNLTCTMGKGTFQYEQGVKYTEENAHCGADGFHATDNPLGVLSYYNKSDDRYFLVELGGNIDEDGVNSRISGDHAHERTVKNRDVHERSYLDVQTSKSEDGVSCT